MTQIKLRLIVMNFLQFAVWGSWLISLGAYLGGTLQFSGTQIGSFFATMGIASLITPALFGIIADKWIPDERLISFSHIISGGLMLMAARQTDYFSLYTCILLSVFFYMPTLGLTNAVAYNMLNKAGLDTVKHFPPIRVFGTIGFIVAMVAVDLMGLKTSHLQLVVSALLSFVLAAYMFTFKPSRVVSDLSEKGKQSLKERLGLQAFGLFKDRQMALFLIFSALLGICLQITNGFANDYLTKFGQNPEYAGTFGVEHSGVLISISQVSEALCILLIPFFLKRFGIKAVMAISLFAWFFRFGLLGAGNPGSGVWMLILSMVVYGVAFDFFNISGSLYVDQKVEPIMRSSAQGLFILMTNGIGSFVGSYAAGFVVERAGYPDSWYIFAGYALLIGLLFVFLFKGERRKVEV